MNILTFTEAEKYLMNKQVYFRKEISNSDLKTIAESNKVHNVKNVQITRLNDRTIAFDIVVNNVETTIYEYKTDSEMLEWIKTNFVPVNQLVYKWLS